MQKTFVISILLLISYRSSRAEDQYSRYLNTVHRKIKNALVVTTGFTTSTIAHSFMHELGHFIAVRSINNQAKDKLKRELLGVNYSFPVFKKPWQNLLVQVAGPVFGIGTIYCLLRSLKKESDIKNGNKHTFISGMRHGAYLAFASEILELVPIKIKYQFPILIPNTMQDSTHTFSHKTHGHYIKKDVKEFFNIS